MEVIALLSTHNHWPLSDYLNMRVSELYKWADVFTKLSKRGEKG